MNNFDYSYVTNPRFFRDNVLAAHSDHLWFSPSEKVEIKAHEDGSYLQRESLNTDSAFRRYLNGIWKFQYSVNYASLVKGYESPDFDCHSWTDIHVPAHVQMEGYDVPHYTNVLYPWDGHEQLANGQVPTGFNPACAYVKYFSLPSDFEGQPVFISFQGVESAFAIYLNGQYVGYSEDTFTPSEFELTPYLVPGENKLAITVFKWSTGSWLEDQDFFRFCGIFRDVYLYTIPQVHISDICVKSELNDCLDSAIMHIDVKSTASGRAHLCLKSLLADAQPSSEIAADLALSEGSNHIDITVDKPLLWSAEAPNLYAFTVEVIDTEDKVTEVIPMQIGFRRFELKDGIMKLNNKRIVFKGVNRHEFSSITGRAISYKETKYDLINMKQNNINAIRTCHYPDNSFVYALADNLGLYLIDENNMETHGTWGYGQMNVDDLAQVIPGDNPDWTDNVLDRVNNVYQRDKNHASVLIWSCGNESHGGINIYKMSQKFRELDSTRLVHYEGIFNDRRYPDTSDMESQMYTKAKDIKKFLDEHPGEKPFICCEYSHAMGNSCGGMSKYTDLTDAEPRFQGGFIWDYIDQSITIRDRYGVEFEAYGGDFGDRPSDYNFSGNGIAYGGPNRLSSPKMAEVKYNYQNLTVSFPTIDSFEVTNKNLFVNSSNFNCFISLSQNGHEVAKELVNTDVEPLSAKTYKIPERISSFYSLEGDEISSDLFEYEALYNTKDEFTLTVTFELKADTLFAKARHEIAYGQHTFDVKRLNAMPSLLPPAPYTVTFGHGSIGIKGSDYEIQFTVHGLSSYKKGGVELIKGVPGPAFWRAPVDNDKGSHEPQRYGQWKLADMYSCIIGHEPSFVDGKFCGTYTYQMPTNPSGQFTIMYTIQFDGRVDVELKYNPIEGLGDMPVFGMNFKFDADYDNFTWYGYGPGESYIDRCHGNKLGIYTNKVKDNMSAYLVPQECGNKTNVRWAKVTDRKGRGIAFSGNCIDVQALPYSAHEIENATHHTELPAIHYTFVRVALAQLGIAGDDSWGSRCHEEFQIDVSKPLVFNYSFKAI